MFDLLDAVLPAEGRYCVFGLGKFPDQRFCDTRAEVDAIAQEFVKNNVNAFYGCAKYGDLNNRTHINAKYFRALWIDVDCGEAKADEGKGYRTQAEGLRKFKEFCTTTKLPAPIIVDSGYGIHAYWLLEETIGRMEWEALADRLHELCKENEFIVDPAVFEASRVLRIPGTFNYKGTDPAEVKVINDISKRIPYATMKELLGAPEPKEQVPDFIPRGLSPLMSQLVSNRVKRFQTIMLKSVKGEGCAQLLHCFQNQDTIEYNVWRSALSIASFCVDRDSAIHKMSSKHPEYDFNETERKADNLVKTGAPHHCATFDKNNKGYCDGCTHRGKIKSPIVLGEEIAEADDEDNTIEVESEEGIVETHHIPEYPFPFFRGKNGGIYRRGDDEEDDVVQVYEHDLYVLKRLIDPDAGEVVLIKLHLPKDGIKEFVVPLTAVTVKEELRKTLAHYGVVLFTKQLEQVYIYMVTAIKNMQVEKRADIMRTQFGWVDNDSKFVIGEREITKDGVFYSPPSTTTRGIVEHLSPMGTLDKWKEVFNLYSRPGLEGHAFAALTAFGSPLLKFTGMSGAIINLIHERSGSGKSTALFMCNSVYGHPVKLASQWKDTPQSKMHRLGVMNNLSNTIDEITNTSPAEFSDLAYSISQGRGKDKMKSDKNEMRLNLTSWNNMTLSSANASFYQKLGALKNTPDGESMRLIEYKIEPTNIIDVALGKQMFDHQLRENYGHAGEIYAQWLVNNLEEAKDLIKHIQARIDKEVQFTAPERFWSAVCACNIAGGLIAKKLGLHDYDMKAVYKWLVKMLSEMREDVKPPVDVPFTVLGDYCNAHVAHTLVVNGEVDSRSGLNSAPLLEPKQELLIRYEPDTKILYMVAKPFKDYCVKFQINHKELLVKLKEIGVYKETMNKRMAKGMKVVSPAVRVLMFDASSNEFLQIEPNEDRDSELPDQLETV
jgi:hypothetical protein